MESDESRSSPTNSSESGNSRVSTPAKVLEEGVVNQSVDVKIANAGRPRSRTRSGSSSILSSKSSSDSSSSLSSDSEDDSKTPTLGNSGKTTNAGGDGADGADIKKSKKKNSSSSSSSGSSSSSSSSSDEAERTERRPSRESVSAEKSRQSQSSKQSFLSSVQSQNNSNSPFDQRNNAADGNIHISHDDLSEISDMECDKRDFAKVDDQEDAVEKTINAQKNQIKTDQDDLRNKIESKKSEQKDDKSDGTNGVRRNNPIDDLDKKHDDEPLDFEAEEGEFGDICKDDGEVPDDGDDVDDNGNADKGGSDNGDGDGNGDGSAKVDGDIAKINTDTNGNSTEEVVGKTDDKENNDKEELEEGEVTDEDEKRPEENEPKPICRFYTRGQCTWGMSCRFLHPGVTDKGNYTMFDNMIRAVPMTQSGAVGGRPTSSNYSNHATDYHEYRTERPPLHHRPAPMHHQSPMYMGHHEGRGMLPDVPVVVENAWERGLRTAKEMMRKANKRKEQDMDFEDKKMNLTLSPEELDKDPYYSKECTNSPAPYAAYTPPDRYCRAPAPYMMPFDDVDAYGRSTRYRELPPHRMPQYEDDRRLRPTREVIVQRLEPIGRPDEWSDPWMRSKSPGGRSDTYEREERRRRDRDRRSYTSNTSYTTTNSSQSDSSSESSRSSSLHNHRKRRYTAHKVHSSSRRHTARAGRSLSPVSRRLRRSPSPVSPSYKRQAVDKRNTYSPATKRKKLSPNAKKAEKSRRRPSSSSSDSDSSASTYSEESESGSSSSESSSGSREHSAHKRIRASDKALSERKPIKKAEPTIKKRSPITIELKKPSVVGISALASPTHSVNSDKDVKKSRREELLKQLRAVEDAIAKKRSKLV